MMRFNKKNAYSLAEMMLVLLVLSVFIGYVATRVLNQSPDIEKMRIKKAYLTIEKTVSSMLDNGVLYSQDLMFKNLEAVTTTVGDQFGVKDVNTKFRDVFMYYQNIVGDFFECSIFIDNQPELVNNCFKTSDGVVYGIPDTDFETVGVVDVLDDSRGSRSHKYLPITVYPNFELKNDARTDTMVVGVRHDGRIKLITEDCDEDNISCNVLELLHSDSVKRDWH